VVAVIEGLDDVRTMLARAREDEAPAAIGDVMRWLEPRMDVESRRLFGDAATWLADYHLMRERHAAAADALVRALDAYRAAGDTERIAITARRLGREHHGLGRNDAAIAAFDEAIANTADVPARSMIRVERANALISRGDHAGGREDLEGVIAMLAEATDDADRCALAAAYTSRARLAVETRPADALGDHDRALAIFNAAPHDAETRRAIAECLYNRAIAHLQLKDFDAVFTDVARSMAMSTRTGDRGQLQFVRALALLGQTSYSTFRAALVELLGAIALLERAVALTDNVFYERSLAQARPLLPQVTAGVRELDRSRTMASSARCAFCNATPQQRTMIAGDGDARICTSCCRQARTQVDETHPRDAATGLRAGEPKARKNVRCSFCGEARRRQFIVADPYKICDECLDSTIES
jgi:tetratricopeptide (TPR) repeat protein